MTSDPIHCFEKAGLGKAGFLCVGFAAIPPASLAAQNPSAYMLAMSELPRDVGCGSCQYCGTAIMNNFIIESSDRKRFVVGSECVRKTGDAGLIKEVKRIRVTIAKEKRDAKRRMKREEREALWKAERADRAAIFVVEHAALIERAKPFMEFSDFINDVINRGIGGGFMSDKALEAVERSITNLEENARMREVSRYVGTVGKRQVFKVRIQRVLTWYRPAFNSWNGREEPFYIVTMRDENDNAIISKSAAFCPKEGETLTIKATIKEHKIYKDEQQTVVQRVAAIN